MTKYFKKRDAVLWRSLLICEFIPKPQRESRFSQMLCSMLCENLKFCIRVFFFISELWFCSKRVALYLGLPVLPLLHSHIASDTDRQKISLSSLVRSEFWQLTDAILEQSWSKALEFMLNLHMCGNWWNHLFWIMGKIRLLRTDLPQEPELTIDTEETTSEVIIGRGTTLRVSCFGVITFGRCLEIMPC